MMNKTERQQSEYNYRKKRNLHYINQHIKHVNMKDEINSKLKNLGYHNRTFEELKQFYGQKLLNDGCSPEDIEKILREEAKSRGINKYNSQEIKKFNDKLLFVNNYITFLEGKITRTN